MEVKTKTLWVVKGERSVNGESLRKVNVCRAQIQSKIFFYPEIFSWNVQTGGRDAPVLEGL